MKLTFCLASFLVLVNSVRADERVTANDLKQIGLAYHAFHDANNRGPANAEQLAPFFENSKKLLDHLKTKRIEFFYNVRITDMTEGTTNTVLAYEKDTPTKGGFALYGDGTVRKLSAEQFKKAILAKKQ